MKFISKASTLAKVRNKSEQFFEKNNKLSLLALNKGFSVNGGKQLYLFRNFIVPVEGLSCRCGG